MPGPTTRALLITLLLSLSTLLQAEEALKLGIFPRRSATQTTELFTPLANYLSTQLRRPVQLIISKDFDTFWQGVKRGEYDIVHYNQYHYVQSSDRYTVIACNQEQGKETIAGAIYVREDSGITEVSQLRGRKIIFGGGQDAMMSYIVPHYLLLQHGLSVNAGDYEEVYASNPLNAVLAVYFSQADAGGAGDVVMELPNVKNITQGKSLRYLLLSEPITQLPWAVRRDMPLELKNRVRTLMVSLSGAEDGAAILKAARLSGISAIEDSDYDATRRIIDVVTNDKPATNR